MRRHGGTGDAIPDGAQQRPVAVAARELAIDQSRSGAAVGIGGVAAGAIVLERLASGAQVRIRNERILDGCIRAAALRQVFQPVARPGGGHTDGIQQREVRDLAFGHHGDGLKAPAQRVAPPDSQGGRANAQHNDDGRHFENGSEFHFVVVAVPRTACGGPASYGADASSGK